MKKNFLAPLLLIQLLLHYSISAQNDYYFPKETKVDAAIPTPEEFLGYEIGTHYTRHDQIIAYFYELAKLSDKITVEEIGKSYEHRPLAVATITSPENHDRLEDIRTAHVKTINAAGTPKSAAGNPVIVLLDYSVHGAETSSGEASLLTAYYLVASTDAKVSKYLSEAVILIDIAQNPDGRDRSANWHNAYKSTPPVADPFDKEHLELFPGGRTNHYFTDLNRDWLSVTQKETKPKIDFFHRWYPNVHIDFHEMGGNSTYYFEPTPKRTESPIIPAFMYDLNHVMAKYFSEALDDIGSLYFTKEVFDNFSPVYGSTYPDFHGGIGVTFEQGSSRGLLQETDNGLLEFRFTIKNQLVTGIAAIKGAVEEKQKLFDAQKNFFKTAISHANTHPAKAYIFGDENDQSLTNQFVSLLLRHRINVYELPSDQSIDGQTFAKGSSYVVPSAQPQFKIIHAIFEETPAIKDSVFYGSTSYSIIHAYGLPYRKSAKAIALGEQLKTALKLEGSVIGGKGKYAYITSWTEYNAPKALYFLQSKGVNVKAAFKPLTTATSTGNKSFGYGSLVIPVVGQPMSDDALFDIVKEAAALASINIYSLNGGMSVAGVDLGSNNIRTVRQPNVAVIMGQGVSSAEAGQVWYLMNEHLAIPLVKIDPALFPRVNLSKYTSIILPSGNYTSWDKSVVEKLSTWVKDGGALIAFGNAGEWVINNDLVKEEVYKPEAPSAKTERIDYVNRMDALAPDRISGNIFTADLDITNPIAFGVQNRKLFVSLAGGIPLLPSKNPFATVAKFSSQPHVNGYISKNNLAKFSNKAFILANSVGSGSVILFSEDPTYRKYWYGTDRLLTNSIFFGNMITTNTWR